MRVLVVDDETDFRESLVEILQIKGHSTLDAGSVADYFALESGESFDLAVIDRQLTDGDGLQILEHIRETRKIPAVLITGSAEFELANPNTQPAADLCIAKPFAVQPLLDFIEQIDV
jgi:DNA-binding NtrC family response regulator